MGRRFGIGAFVNGTNAAEASTTIRHSCGRSAIVSGFFGFGFSPGFAGVHGASLSHQSSSLPQPSPGGGGF
jgi:hypothetical protein